MNAAFVRAYVPFVAVGIIAAPGCLLDSSGRKAAGGTDGSTSTNTSQSAGSGAQGGAGAQGGGGTGAMTSTGTTPSTGSGGVSPECEACAAAGGQCDAGQ